MLRAVCKTSVPTRDHIFLAHIEIRGLGVIPKFPTHPKILWSPSKIQHIPSKILCPPPLASNIFCIPTPNPTFFHMFPSTHRIWRVTVLHKILKEYVGFCMGHIGFCSGSIPSYWNFCTSRIFDPQNPMIRLWGQKPPVLLGFLTIQLYTHNPTGGLG